MHRSSYFNIAILSQLVLDVHSKMPVLGSGGQEGLCQDDVRHHKFFDTKRLKA